MQREVYTVVKATLELLAKMDPPARNYLLGRMPIYSPLPELDKFVSSVEDEVRWQY